MGALSLWWLAPLGALAALAGAWHCRRRVLGSPADGEAARTARLIEAGLGAWNGRQGRFFLQALAAAFLLLLAASFALGVLPRVVPFAFLSGALLSALGGLLGTRLAAAAAARAAAGARESALAAWITAFRASAAVGLATAGLGLLDLCAWFAGLFWLAPLLGSPYSLAEIAAILMCLVLGAGLQSLLARVAGGTFAGAAGLGAELLARSEPSVPEEDHRNPALVVSRVARLAAGIAAPAADLFESQGLALAAAAVLGVAAFGGDRGGPEAELAAALLPMIVAGIGAGLSLGWVLANSAVKNPPAAGAPPALHRATAVCAGAMAVGSAAVVALILPRESFGLWGAIVAGLAAAAVAARSSAASLPAPPAGGAAARVRGGEAGLAGALLEGLGSGLRGAWLQLGALTIVAPAAFLLAGGSASEPAPGFYGVALAAVGMLSLLGIAGAASACQPVMAGVRDVCRQGGTRERVEALGDGAGAATSAARGFALCAAGLAALAAIPAILEAFRVALRAAGPGAATEAAGGFAVAPSDPLLLAGALFGALAVCLFAALLLGGLGGAAVRLTDEARRQWRMIPGLSALKPEALPEPAAGVGAALDGVQPRALLPVVLAMILPAAAGVLLGAAGALGFAAGTLAAGLPLALILGGAGCAWDASGRFGNRGFFASPLPGGGRLPGEVLRDLAGPGLAALFKMAAIIAVVTAGLAVRLSGAGSLLGWLAGF